MSQNVFVNNDFNLISHKPETTFANILLANINAYNFTTLNRILIIFPICSSTQDSDTHGSSQNSNMHGSTQDSSTHGTTQESITYGSTQDSSTHDSTQDSSIHGSTQDSSTHGSIYTGLQHT